MGGGGGAPVPEWPGGAEPVTEPDPDDLEDESGGTATPDELVPDRGGGGGGGAPVEDGGGGSRLASPAYAAMPRCRLAAMSALSAAAMGATLADTRAVMALARAWLAACCAARLCRMAPPAGGVCASKRLFLPIRSLTTAAVLALRVSTYPATLAASRSDSTEVPCTMVVPAAMPCSSVSEAAVRASTEPPV